MSRAWIAAALIALSRVAVADSSYHIGNSLTYDMIAGGLQDIGTGFGVPLTVGYHIRSSQSLVYIQNHPDDATLFSPAAWPDGLAQPSWNFVTFQPYPDPGSPSTLQSDIQAADTFIARVPRSPRAEPVFYIYAAWPNQNDFQASYSMYWNQAISDAPGQRTILARRYFDLLHEHLTTKYRDSARIHVIPVGDVFARLDAMIATGEFAGATRIADFYRDIHHLGTAGKYVAALTTFATLYGRSPSGASHAALDQLPLEGRVALTPEVASQLERVVWEVVTGDSARTGVYPFRLSTRSLDFEPTLVGEVARPQTVELRNVTGMPLALEWLASSPVFGVSHGCGTSLAAGATCTVSVTFSPAMAGGSSGTLTLQARGGPYQVELAGRAPVQATLSAASSAAMAGQPITLTWTASAGATCQARSDVPSTSWSGSLPASGSRSFTEPNPGPVQYSIDCSAAGVSAATASTLVTWSPAPVTTPASQGGGGALDLTLLLGLAGMMCARRTRRALTSPRH